LGARRKSRNLRPRAQANPRRNLPAQADKLYAEREDLARLRAGLALLRRARALEPGNYEAAWRSARFNETWKHEERLNRKT
jgi:hypothetical protein